MFLVLIEHFNSTVAGKHILYDSILLNSFNAMPRPLIEDTLGVPCALRRVC